MNRTRIVLLGILAVLVAVWVSSATLPPPEPPSGPKATTRASKPPVSASTRHRQDVTSFSLNEAAERLRSHLNAAPRPESPERNPFEFVHAAAPKPVAATPAPSPLAAAEPVGPPPPPLLTLTGMAERQKDQTLERTAILSSNSQMIFARVGDKVLARYEVTAIGADAIELRDAETGQTLRLGLR